MYHHFPTRYGCFNLKFWPHHNINRKVLVSCLGWEGFGYVEVLIYTPSLRNDLSSSFDEGVVECNLQGAGL